MSNVELHLRPGGSSIVIDGVNVSNRITGLSLSQSATDRAPRLNLEYACHEVEADGVMKVTHLCPLKEDE